MKMSVLVAAGLAAGVVASSSADVVAYWNFNQGLSSGSPSAQVLSANVGSGTMTTNWAAANFLAFTPAGASAHNGLNALNGDPDGNDIGLQNGTVSSDGSTVLNAGRYVQFQINMANYQDLVLTMAARRTATGMATTTVEYSTDGSNFTVAGVFAPFNTSAYALATFDLSSISAIEFQSSVYIRLVLSNPVPNSSGNLSSGGNNRIDNVQFNATFVPTPGAAVLAGLGALAAVRRRR